MSEATVIVPPTSDITIANPLPSLVIALPAALSERAATASAQLDDALARFAEKGITTAPDFADASAAYGAAQKLEKDIEKARKEAKHKARGKAAERAARAAKAAGWGG